MVAIALTFVAGFVDAVGYLSLRHILNANMSGNTIAIGYNTIQGHPDVALERGFAVLMFVVGLFIAAFIHEFGHRHDVRSVSVIPFALEIGLLLAYISLGQPVLRGEEVVPLHESTIYWLLALSTLAMGIQNATLTRAEALSVRTTHVTGTISKFAEATSRYLFWFYDRLRAGRSLRFTLRASRLQRDFIDSQLTALLWIAFLAGGFAGAYLKYRIELFALLAPVAVLIVVIAVDMMRPFRQE